MSFLFVLIHFSILSFCNCSTKGNLYFILDAQLATKFPPACFLSSTFHSAYTHFEMACINHFDYFLLLMLSSLLCDYPFEYCLLLFLSIYSYTFLYIHIYIHSYLHSSWFKKTVTVHEPFVLLTPEEHEFLLLIILSSCI